MSWGVVLTCGALDVSELQKKTQADILVQVDADFRMVEGERVLFAEDAFPVVELARSLLGWDREEDFSFNSMSYEEIGSVRITREEAGWVFGSVFEPGVVSRPVPWSEVEACVTSFVEKVRLGLVAVGLDPELAFASQG
ncbi:hypothetical protein ACIA49_03685 [Kribbella sp. NPDC051587]|uniref:DUF7878 domain-containing protein n=1 Tax=Kribbella sp. NPDC051587 TaxID=3364119 RepID=UPI00379D72BB